jgi:hypothetical protein
MGTWTSVSKLSVTLETGEQQRETGSNYPKDRIGVVISIQPTDNSGNPVHVDTKTLSENTSLIDYVDESPLDLTNSSQWYYEKTTEITAKGNRTPQIKYYVSHTSDPRLRTRSIGIHVRTASGESIYSSLNGTYHSSVRITAAAH